MRTEIDWYIPLPNLNLTAVVEFARHEVANTLGLDCEAHFFLAGGAFKSLLTGKPPRDLDIWAASQTDRDRLIQYFNAKNARPLPPKPFSDTFLIADRVIEIPHKTADENIEKHVAGFDIGLSAIGVEYSPQDTWNAYIHPLAFTSVQNRQILLLKPLVNWKYALTTLERMRRYAEELDFAIPIEEEKTVWQIFKSQSPNMQTGMLERFKRTSLGKLNIREEMTFQYL